MVVVVLVGGGEFGGCGSVGVGGVVFAARRRCEIGLYVWCLVGEQLRLYRSLAVVLFKLQGSWCLAMVCGFREG